MPAARPSSSRRAYWLKTLHEWHWVSSALCLVGLLLFSITGFTLNHAGQIEAKPKIENRVAQIDEPLLREAMQRLPAALEHQGRAELPVSMQSWIREKWDVATAGREAEWSKEEIYLSLPRPGGDAWLRLNLQDGELEYERTDRGWLSYFNDLHKGRNTGVAWSWFIDIFAAAALVFSITGLFILKMHAGNRPFTWPMTAMGLVIPLLLALLFIH